MTTDKELADAIGVVLDNCHGSLSRDMLLKAKGELDPTPTYPDGTYAHVTHGNPAHTTIARFNASANRWVVDWSWDGFDEAVLEEGCVDLVEPLRVLGDDEIALPVVTKAVGQLHDYADYLSREYFYGNCGSAVLSAYVKAVQMAEVGDAE